MAQSGLSVPTYAYALNNPLRYVDRNGLEVYAADARATQLIAQMRMDPRGAALYDYLQSSPYIYRVTADAPVPAGLKDGVYGQFRPGVAEGKNTCNAGGNIDLYDQRVRRDAYNPVTNLAHELTHGGLFDNQYLSRPGAPEPIPRFTGSAVDGALPPGPHHAMEFYWQLVFGAGP